MEPTQPTQETLSAIWGNIGSSTTTIASPVNTSSPRISKTSRVGDYSILKPLGRGNCGAVRLAKHIPTGEMVAIKKIDKTRLNTSNLEKLTREVRIMKRLDHPSVIKLFQVIDEEIFLYLVMQYAEGGTVFNYLRSGRLEEDEARRKFRQIFSAIQYCHQNKITHRDIKSENILLDCKMNIKLIDFGFSREFDSGNQLNTDCGTPAYAAPQLFLGEPYDGREVDVWSLGVILFELVTSSVPFGQSSLKEIKKRVLNGKYHLPLYLSTMCNTLINKMLVLDPSKRISMEEIAKDEWFNVGSKLDDKTNVYLKDQTFDVLDQKRLEILDNMGYSRKQVEESLQAATFDNCYASYVLLGQKIDRAVIKMLSDSTLPE